MQLSITQLQIELDRNGLSAASLLAYAQSTNMPFRWHPLGFLACTFIVDGPWKARLHFWPVAQTYLQANRCEIHDHVFDFSSWVLVGEVENIVYHEDSLGTEYSIYQTEYAEDRSILKKTTGTIRLAVSSSCSYPLGSKYTVRAGQLHETRRKGNAPAVTVLITRDVVQTGPTVIGPREGDQRYEYVRSIIPNEELRRILIF